MAYRIFISLVMIFCKQALLAQKQVKPVLPLTYEKGKLLYNADSLGNRIPDFSYCGYKASEESIPSIAVKVMVSPGKGDATARIQAAIDHVSSLQPDANGFRGAVLLLPGRFEVYGQLTIHTSGVVLRGSGTGNKGTIVVGAGNDRATLIRISGNNDRTSGKEQKITTTYVPVNARTFEVADAAVYRPGDNIIIRRPSTGNWIKALGTDHFGGGITALGWKPGEHDLLFDRTIQSVKGNQVTIDAPLTTALDTTYGGGWVAAYEWKERIEKVGIENMQLISACDTLNNVKDEDHRWMAITAAHVQHAWIRQISFRHFAGSAVMLLETAKNITVEDCISAAPVSEIGGERRNTFYTAGQQTLFQRCVAYNGIHDFGTGYCVPGPNAFVQCESYQPFGFSGGLESWASGVLFDMVNVDGEAIRLGNRGQDGNGAGWAIANSVLWNCSAARIDCYKPPGAYNWSFGSWSQFSGDGYWGESNNSIQPRSLFYAQLSERLQKNVSSQAWLMDISTEASSSPTVAVALELTKEAYQPKPQLVDWINNAFKRTPIDTKPGNAKNIDATYRPVVQSPVQAPSLQIQNGWIVRGNHILAGKRADVPWWSGGIHGKDLYNAKPAITRFVPGRIGKGFTDELEAVTDTMLAGNTIGIEQHYGLWYDRRRDDHERIRRMDGDVWAPFYELPFARSGKGIAWDGLSKYDLTRYNQWYWKRLKQFADLADAKGLVLVHQQYFQHNIIEAGAHYADFPWRTANNINNVGFPEPVNYAGDKRIFMAEQFYDTAVMVRNRLHKQYIWQCLNNFRNNNGVIQLIGEEFTGPLHFVQFWADAIASWQQKNKKHPLIGLSVTKDVQDAILADKKRNAIIDIIDIRYWHYQADGSLYAPPGGQNLAPRQHARLLKPKRSLFEQVYRAVKEYKQQYPAKAVMYSGDGAEQFGWAVLLAGGSLPVLPATTDRQLLNDVATMQVVTDTTLKALSSVNSMLLYAGDNPSVQINLSGKQGKWLVKYIKLSSGTALNETILITGGSIQTVAVPQGAGLVWLQQQK